MSNEETGRLIDLISRMIEEDEKDCGCVNCCAMLATRIAGNIESRYRLTPIEDNQQETEK